MHPCVGYFDDPSQTVPTFDPGYTDTPCLICYKPLGGDPAFIRTISLMWADRAGDKSLFYRVHRACQDSIGDAEQERIEGALLDELRTGGTDG